LVERGRDAGGGEDGVEGGVDGGLVGTALDGVVRRWKGFAVWSSRTPWSRLLHRPGRGEEGVHLGRVRVEVVDQESI
jgi:hypothetical protein